MIDPREAPREAPVIPAESRFENDPSELLESSDHLPEGWTVGSPDPGDHDEVARLTDLLRTHEEAGRGWPGAGIDDVLVEVSEAGLRTRQNVVVRDAAGTIQAWGSVHDRSVGRMLFVHVVARDLPDAVALVCSDVLVAWAVGQAGAVGAARGLAVQQIDTGAFADDERQHRMLERDGFERTRTWWQMSRPVATDEATLVPDPRHWEARGVTFRLVDATEPDDLEHAADLHAVHDILEEAFTDHFNSTAETYAEWLHRQQEDPGHRWDQWWLAELSDPEDPESTGDQRPTPVGALVGTIAPSATGPTLGSYVSYIGVVEAARGRGVAKGLLSTIIADAAARGHDHVGLEVDADSSTGADGLYVSMGWATRYVTESWHRDVPVTPAV